MREKNSESKITKHLISISVLLSVCLGLVITVFNYSSSQIGEGLLMGSIAGIFFIYPFILTAINLFFLCSNLKKKQLSRKGRHMEYITIFLGSTYTIMVLPFTEITSFDWTETLYNSQRHIPVWTQAIPTVLVLVMIGVLGYVFLV